MLRKFLLVNPYRNCEHPATLTYDEETKKFGMTIPKEARLEELPAVPKVCAMQGVYELDDRITRMFVRDRIIPPERINIGKILRDVGIDRYDEFAILEFNSGRSCQDDFIMQEIKES
jgi:hypothetical protein